MVTIKDVAERAAVSISTASRILSNSTTEKFSEATQAKVLRASLELGYRPNFAARALVSGKTRIIAAVFPRIVDSPFTALASLQILAGIEGFCSENGYHTLISSPRIIDGEADANFTAMLAGGYPDGVIIDQHFHIAPIIAALAQFNLPTVGLGHSDYPHRIECDNFVGAKQLMHHVLELGHCSIGIVGVPDGISLSFDARLQGIRAAAEQCGLPFARMPRSNGRFSSESGAAAAAELLTAHPELTALVALNDRMAMGAIRQAQKMGYNVPEQLSVVGYDDLPQSVDFHPPLTTVNQHLADWGTLAMTMLLDLINGGSPTPVILEPKLVTRKSAAPLA